jgi:hypothetical protein
MQNSSLFLLGPVSIISEYDEEGALIFGTTPDGNACQISCYGEEGEDPILNPLSHLHPGDSIVCRADYVVGDGYLQRGYSIDRDSKGGAIYRKEGNQYVRLWSGRHGFAGGESQ